ncbi:latent-transforming growth factor beta-binding protein 2 isoform X6 [Poecilia latipinna]|uniref:latent-transforming growth factor beta-binding protein 2 isoform X6 n=1 Tax=Poecilia latipinna TaxID=48699 RepID=UPI00072E9E89|nr:PREDICTED: latent-transforming growth factor beta-binding protein 2-like isoform X6 [Poecilia latipinna]
MRLGLLCLWTGWMLRSAASQPQDGGVRPGGQLQTEPEGVRTGFRSQSSGDPAGGARRRAALSGPRVCGGRCCLGWTVSPKTKRCTKPRCFPPCRNGSSCGLPNNCLCRKGFYGARCQFSSVPLPVRRPPETSSHPASTSPAAGPIGSSQKPEPPGSFQKLLNSNNSSPLKSGRLAGQAEGMKGDPGDVTLRFLNGTSSGSTGLMRADAERQSSDSKHVLELKLQTNRENKNPLRSESLELQASLEVKEDEDPTGAERRPEEMKRQIPSLREAQSVLLRNSLSRGRGGNMAALLMKHIRREKRKLHTLTSSSSSPTTMRAFQNQRGRVDSHLAAPKVLCPLLCKNGGVCLQTDRCLCPANFTGKFCQIPVPPPGAASTNEIVRLPLPSSAAANQELMRSEFLLPLGQTRAAPPSADPRMVKVRVQHPPEASVKIHQVMKVSGSSPALRTLSSSSSSGSAGAPAPAPAGGARIQAQTLRGGGTYNQQSGFKYCFREVKDGQCSSPLPGLRSREVCCRGIGKAWGLTDCSLCPEAPGQSNSSCPVGFERTNGTQCVDVNECLQPGLCENGICVNTRGSYSCVCRLGFILDATHGICISQSVISEEKGQCYRVLGSSRGPYTCSLPIVRNITKQICCCSRVGKAWGPDCVRCPFFGSVAFKEICPAGPGYHYSASTLQISQRVDGDSTGRESLLTAQGGSDLVPGSSTAGASSSQQRPSSSGSPSGTRTGPVQSQIQVPAQPGVTAVSRPTPPAGSATRTAQARPEVQHGRPEVQHGRPEVQHGRPEVQHGRPDPQHGRLEFQNGRLDSALARPQPPLALPSSGSQPDLAPVPADSLPTPAPPRTSERGSRPGPEPPGLERRPAASPTSRPGRVQPVRGVCQIRPGVCERGRCVDLPGGKHTCECDEGFQPNAQRSRCFDVDECQQNPCSNGRCENSPGSFRCDCYHGYRLTGNTCEDVDECVSSGGSVCPSRRCENTIGSFRCLATCQPGQRVAADGSCVGPPVSAPASAAAASQPAAPRLPSSVPESGSRPESTHSSSSSGSQISAVDVSAVLHHSSAAQPGELRDCYYNLAAGGCSLLAANTSQQECCCTAGEGWGWGCRAHACPAADTADFLSLCLSGRGYVTAGSGSFSYTDVDECKRFHPEVCKNGVCVNNIPGYRCYCSSGFVYSAALLECIDYDECEEESCVGGVCVNTVGSFYCSCPPPLVLDDTQRNCVNASHLTMDENLSLCWQHVSADLLCQSPLLGAQVTFIDCCCFYGEGWGMGCALCPATDSEDYASLCSSYSAAAFPGSFPDSAGPETGPGRGAAPYSPEFFPAAPLPGRDFSQDYDDYLPAGGSRSGFRARPPVSFAPPDDAYGGSEFSPGFYPEGDYGSPDGSAPRTPALQLPPDPRSDIVFMARPLPPSRPDPPPLSLALRPGPPYDDREGGDFRGWRPGAGLPPFTDSGGGGGGGPPRVYERRYETHASLSAAEDCGILHGCENGQCIRVAEGYTCDCYAGFELDLTSMSCIDINECEDAAALPFPCVNARCVNTEGSFRCVCRRGYVMSRRRNHCIAA